LIHPYLNELSKIQLLSATEESILWKQYKTENSREARHRIIESYQPLVYKIASRISGNEEVFFDLIQEGILGLIESVENFDLKYEVKFSTFAQHRIRGRMIDFLTKLQHFKEPLEVALGEEEFTGVLNQIEDRQVNVEEEVTLKMLSNQVNQAISRLNPKEQQVIRDLYLLDKDPVTSAAELNISLSYLYKIQKKALQRLRGMLAKLRTEMKASG
jgi:RNA polymerase sporulation-specific sigma factor